jgi:hypothetical protein
MEGTVLQDGMYDLQDDHIPDSGCRDSYKLGLWLHTRSEEEEQKSHNDRLAHSK